MKYKILYALNRARIAGTERHVLALLDHMNRDIFELSVVCFSEGPLIQELQDRGVKVFSLPRKRFLDFGVFKKLYQLMKEYTFDLVHSHSGQLACFIGKLAGVLHTVETRHGLCINYDALDKHKFKGAVISKLKASQVSLTLLVNQSDYDIMHETFKIPAAKLRCVVNGIDISGLESSDATRKQLKQEFGLKEEINIVGTVARFEEQKGLEYLIKAIHILKDVRNIHFVLVGDGSLRENLTRLARELEVLNLITFTGYRSDAISLISLFDIFVLPSIWEGLPYTILEAMALKKPVISTEVFGNKEIVKDGETGYLVKPRCPQAIADSIRYLLQAKGKASRMGEAGFERVTKLYSAQKMTREIEKIYFEMSSDKRTG